MTLGAYFLSFILPLQLGLLNSGVDSSTRFWAAQATIDTARIIGLGSYRNKVPLENHNPELYLRQAFKEDEPMPRRKQFIQSYVTNSVVMATR